MLEKLEIQSDAAFSTYAKRLGISTMGSLMQYVQELPYGRTSDKSKLHLVFEERKGTCSSKHALIKAIANENALDELELIIGIYKMSSNNTPGIGDAIEKSALDHIPEAHCYLKWKGGRIDITAQEASFERIKNDLLEEQTIEPSQVGAYKVAYHQQYLKNWIIRERIPLDFETVWAIREACIANLSN